MAAIIEHNPLQILVSYGHKVQVKESADLSYRNRVGVEIELNGVQVGAAEVDVFAKNTLYNIEVGEIVKSYINKGGPTVTGWVVDNIASMKITPYSRVMVSGGSWNTSQGTPVTSTAIRGIHSSLYLSGDYTPKEPDGSIIFSNFPSGTYNSVLPPKAYRNIYVAAPTTAQTYTNLVATSREYGVDESFVEAQVGATHVSGGASDATRNMFAVNMHSTATYITGITPSRKTIRISAEKRDSSDDSVIETHVYNMEIEYKCAKSWDFQLTLLYLGYNFMYNSIPFYLKNSNSLERSVNTIDGYNNKKRDYNLKVRRTFQLKSDFMPSDMADEAVFLATSENTKVKFDSIDGFKDARILNKSLRVISHRNDGMVQLEVDIELSAPVPTP